MKRLATVLIALALFAVVSNTRAVASLTSVTYTGSAPTNLKSEKGLIFKSSATFTVSNLDLVITLSNISTNDPRSSADILTGIFFNISTNLTLTPVSAKVAPGKRVFGPLLGYNGDVSGQWAYRGDLSTGSLSKSKNAPGKYGLASTKFSFFKKKNLFSDTKIPRTSPLSGAQFGVTTLDDLTANDQGNIKNANLIQDTIVLVLNGLPVNFSLADISGVTFVFGTNIKKGINIAGEMASQIPEPSTLMLVAVALAGVLTLTRSSARRR